MKIASFIALVVLLGMAMTKFTTKKNRKMFSKHKHSKLK